MPPSTNSTNSRHVQDWTLPNSDVVLLAAPFGFGPLSKALSLAEILRQGGHSVTILADRGGAAIARSMGYSASSYAYREPLDLSALRPRAVVSCMDISTPIEGPPTPFVVVDSLYWMRGNWERDYTSRADIYIAQRFAESRLTPLSGANPVESVDAILRSAFINQAPSGGEPRGVVIYPGGLGSPYLSQTYRLAYVEWVLAGFMEAASDTGFDVNGSTLVLPTVDISTPSMTAFARAGGDVVAEFARLPEILRSAQHALIAPGIEISLEAAAVGHHPLFLPAFNGSHVAQVPPLLQLEFGRLAVPTHADELQSYVKPEGNLRASTAAVQSFNTRVLSAPWARDEFRGCLAAALSSQPAPRRPRFPLGWDGANQAATLIQEVLP